MDRDDPEKRIAELERQLAEQRAAGDPGANRGSQQGAFPPPPQAAFPPPPQAGFLPPPQPGFLPPPTGGSALTMGGWLTPEQVRNVAFSTRPVGERGYNEAEVDAFLDRVEAALQDPAGHTLTPEQVRNVTFSKRRIGNRGYNEAEVDAFLDRVEEQLKSQQGAFPPSPQAASPPPMAELQRQHAQAVGQSPQFPDAQMGAGRQSVAAGEPVRCVLIEILNRRRLWRNVLRLDFSGGRPALAIDVGTDAIRVIDLTTNALIASARLAQVTATPKEHTALEDMFPSVCTMPVLDVGVPGLPPLTIGPLPLEVPPDWARRGRYGPYASSWRNTVMHTTKYPNYVVTNADWLTLVEKFGLAPHLEVKARR
jgi:DivIVA domain-containing protein